MSLIDLKDSIVEQDDFSVGASPQHFVKQWGLEPHDITTGIIWQSVGVGKEQLIRGICHLLVEEIHPKGLPELFETLIDLHEFYSTQLDQEEIELLPEPQPITASYGITTTRPEFPIVFDEE